MANRINAFEQKVLRRIYGLTSENGLWRSKYNHELYQLYKNLPMIDFIRLQRLYWVGHVIKMDEQRTPRRILMGEMEGKKSMERPRRRWQDEIGRDAREMLGVRNWKQAALDRDR